MKKVLAIAPYSYLPSFSGGQRFMAHFYEYLGKELDLTVISVAENDFSLVKNYKTIPLLKRSFRRYIDLSLLSKITELVKKENFDTLICEHCYFAWLVYAVRKRTKIRVIIKTQNIEYQRFQSLGRWWWPILKYYEKWCFKKADTIFFITPEDKEFATGTWKINKEKCMDLTYGVDIDRYPDDRVACKATIQSKHAIAGSDQILFFNGVLDYKPNLDALHVILDTINPILIRNNFHYKIIITGKRLPEEYRSLNDYADKNIIYAGFTDNIETYYKATDIFLNPVQSGGGIKTKMVEAIAFGTTLIATETGAAGILRKVCGDKLIVVPDNDWEGFANAILKTSGSETPTPPEYYQYYYNGNIIRKLINDLAE
jgi:glycosyltransferase involved in cell wall biosynthesis